METPPSSPPREEARPSPSRFANIQTNVRNLLRASSVYPDTAVGSPQTTPRVPRVPFLRRIDARISTQRPSVPQQELPSTFAPFASGAGQQTTANPSTPLIQQPAATYSPASLPSSWNDRYEASPAVSQGSWVAPSRQQSGDSESRAETDIEAQQPRRKRKRRRHHNAWIKRKHRQSVHTRHVPTAAQSEQKTRVIWCAASGIFLAAMLTIYLSLALTVSALNQSVHVMFILVILGSTVLFCHSLIRLCIIKLRPQRSHRPRIPEYADINGFKPDVPIRVHLAQDEEIAVAETTNGQPTEEVEGLVKQPPPAYGLWRCSVRVDPNLLHWQRVGESNTEAPATPHEVEAPSTPAPREATVPHRPPSYASDDGVTYAVEATPRSTMLFTQPFPFAQRPPSGVHPAYRGNI